MLDLLTQILYQWYYDPSNGTVSRSNIVISGP